MTGLADIAARAAPQALEVFGAFHPGPDDGTPPRCGTVILLSPREPGFWPHVLAQPEFHDTRPDPLDRWSARVIGTLADELGAHALFPFDGPPWPPFFGWALRTGQAWRSPVGLLVHHGAGLWASIRGALVLTQALDLPPPVPCP